MKASLLLIPLLASSLILGDAAWSAPAAATAASSNAEDAEPLPSNAPRQPYELAAWCYGAMDQYLYIYGEILPDLRDIDRLFGSSVKNEAEPYSADMAAARDELKVLKVAVQAAERASIKVIAPDGVQAVNQGRGIWGPAQLHTRRELARAWLSWALPDRCDSNARELTAKSRLLGEALKYNGSSATEAPPTPINLPDASPAPAEAQAQAPDAAPEPAKAPPPANPDAPTPTAPHAG